MIWESARIGDVCEVVSGATPKTGRPEFWDGDVPWVTPKVLSELDSKTLQDTPRKLTQAGLQSCSARMLPSNSVLFSSRAPIGLVAINTIPVCTNQGFKSLVPKNGNLAPDYLYWWLRLNRQHVDGLGRGATFKEVSKKVVEGIELPLPPLAEQKRIAGILDAADALRAERRESLAQLDTLLQSTFLHMFGDPRFEGNTGEIPTRSVELGDFAKIRTGKLDANAADEDGAYPFFTCAIKPLQINTPAFDTKAVLVAGNGDLNVKYYEGQFNAYQRTYVIESRDESILNPKFLHIFLELYVSELRKKAIGGVIKYIKLPYLREANVELPHLDEQQRFASIVESVERQKARLRAHLAELDALFASLQHRAFRGEL